VVIFLEGNITKNQHYVPQGYLKSFSDTQDKCYVYDKLKKTSFKTNIRNILSKRFFYDFDYESFIEENKINKQLISEIPTKQTIEKILSEIEGYFPNILKNIDKNFKWFSLRNLNRFEVYRFISIQIIRTPNGKKNILSAYKAINNEITEKLENLFFAHELFDIIKCERNPIILEMLLKDYGHMSIGVNKSNIYFLTSDTPVMFINKFNDEKNIVYYPVTPVRCIILSKYNTVDSNLNAVLQDFMCGKYKCKKLYDIPKESYRREQQLIQKLNPQTIDINDVCAEKLNVICAISADRYIISNQKFDIDLYINVIENYNTSHKNQ